MGTLSVFLGRFLRIWKNMVRAVHEHGEKTVSQRLREGENSLDLLGKFEFRALAGWCCVFARLWGGLFAVGQKLAREARHRFGRRRRGEGEEL